MSVTEASPGVLQGAVASALRVLEDIDVVTDQGDADYALSIVATCVPNDCSAGYRAAIQLVEPYNGNDAAMALGKLEKVHPPLRRDLSWDAAREALVQANGYLVSPRGLWVVQWPTASLRATLDEFVAKLDAGCFEPRRLQRRYEGAFFAKDMQTMNSVKPQLVNCI